MKRRNLLLIVAGVGLALWACYRLSPKQEKISVWEGSLGLPALRLANDETLLFRRDGDPSLAVGITHNGTGLDYFQYDPSKPSGQSPIYLVRDKPEHLEPFDSKEGNPLTIGKLPHPTLVEDREYFTQVNRTEEIEGKKVPVSYYDVDGDGWPDYKRTPEGLFRVAAMEWRRTRTQQDILKDKEWSAPSDDGSRPLQSYRMLPPETSSPSH